MSLNPVVPRLRAIRHDAVSASKVYLSIPAGDVLHVSDVVADQLVAASRQFQEVTEDDEPAVEVAPAEPVKKSVAKKSAAKPRD